MRSQPRTTPWGRTGLPCSRSGPDRAWRQRGAGRAHARRAARGVRAGRRGRRAVLPARWPDRYRSTFGGILASCSAAGLAVPLPTTVMILWLALLGVGLGTYIPANNSGVMAAV